MAAAVATVAVLALATSSAARRSDAQGLQGPANGAVIPTTSTVLLEYDEPWYCVDCEGKSSFKVATDPQLANVIDSTSGTCAPSNEPSCPFWAAVGPYAPGTYYWARFISFANGEEHRSDVWSFTVVDPHQVNQTGSFPDATGDSGEAPDVTGVQVSYDPPTGQIRFVATIPGFRSIAKDQGFVLAVDTDQDATTGSRASFGADWYIVVRGSNNTYGAYVWDGDSWTYKPSPAIQILYRDGVMITLNRSDLGGASTAGFNFWFESTKQIGENDDVWDLAPDASVWNYQLPAVTQTVDKPTSPEAPTAVKSVTVRTLPVVATAGLRFRIVPAVVLLSGASVAPDHVRCTLQIAGKRLRGTGTGGCTIRIPASAGGKQLVVAVRATYKGSTATKTLRYRIRRT